MSHESGSPEPSPEIDGGESTAAPDKAPQQIDSAVLGRLIEDAFQCSPSDSLNERVQRRLAASGGEDGEPDSQ